MSHHAEETTTKEGAVAALSQTGRLPIWGPFLHGLEAAVNSSLAASLTDLGGNHMFGTKRSGERRGLGLVLRTGASAGPCINNGGTLAQQLPSPPSTIPVEPMSPPPPERRASVGMSALRQAMSKAPTAHDHLPPASSSPTQPSQQMEQEDIHSIDERLNVLAHSLSHDVLPGLERELTKVRGWIAIQEGRPSETPDLLKAKLEAKHKYHALQSAVAAFKASMGPLHTPNKRAGPFDNFLRSQDAGLDG